MCPLPSCSRQAEPALSDLGWFCGFLAHRFGDLGKGALKAFPWNRDLGASVMMALALSASVCSVSGFVLAKRKGQTRSYQTPEE